MRSWQLSLGLLLAFALGACRDGGSEPRFLEHGTDVLVADSDGDGRANVVTLAYLSGDCNPKGRLTVYRQTTSGVFAAPQNYAVGCYPWWMTLAGINGDGPLDLVVTDLGARNCSEPSTGDAIHQPRPAGQIPGDTFRSACHPVLLALRDLGMPTISAVPGAAAAAAAGIGMSQAIMADMVCASRQAYLLQAFARIGLVPDGGATFLLPRLIGWGRAMELSLMAEKLPADKALEWGWSTGFSTTAGR